MAKRQHVGVADRLVVELEACLGAGDDARAGQRGQLAAAAEEVVVEVRLADVGDAHPLPLRHVLVLIDVAQWVDQGGGAVRLGDHQVGAIAQARLDEVADAHGHAPPSAGALVPLTRM